MLYNFSFLENIDFIRKSLQYRCIMTGNNNQRTLGLSFLYNLLYHLNPTSI